MRVLPLIAVVCAASLLWSAPQRRNKKEEQTQTLQLPRDLPNAVAGDTRRLTFRVTPLSSKGLLSQQIRDALKSVARDTGSETVLKIRAFVAGSGDLRRVRDLVSESFADRRQPLPALTLVHAGGLPLDGAQVVLEYVAAARKDVNPQGLVFLSAQGATSENPTDPVAPLTARSLTAFRSALQAAGSEPADVLRVSCFLSSLENLDASRQQIAAEYPRATLNFVQPERAPARALAACEGVARSRRAAANGIEMLASGSSDAPPAALVSAAQVVLTGSQVSFGYEEKDARLAFERLKKAVEQAGASLEDAAFVHDYPLSTGIASQVRKVSAEFFKRRPGGSSLIFESLPSMDAGFAVDVIAAKR